MKITAIRATPVNIPLEAPYLWSYGSLAGFSKAIVEVETDEGLTGVGEAPSHAHAAIIETRLAPRLVGRDPIDIAGAEQVCVPSWQGVSNNIDYGLVRAFGGIEMALWDLRGKLWNRPLYDLLGGAVRKAIPVTDYFSFRGREGAFGGETTPEEVADYCLGLKETWGTTFFEGKFYTAEPGPSIRMLECLRETLGPDAMLRIDSNMAYGLATARRIARAIEPLDIRNWEDPCGSLYELKQLREHTAIPFSVHSLDLRQAVDLGVPDAVVTDIATHGGIGRTLRFVGACEQMGLDFWCYSGDSGIGSAAYLHLCAAMQHIREPNQSLFRMQPLDVIEEGPFRPRDNLVMVPEGPGLGVTLSPDRLRHCHRLFLDQGPYDKYHDPDRPGVFRRLPLS
ncbi:mandelate racemase/muconate lactonizing enzyme family protein [Labrys monachus]|uniref:glucarate dehydratase n=1 Tax=Labrys monachus TaxID=217067 RepID=A0ABU0FMJ5_9HYPH|nr:mandelate racemase/muconate lactonizing enzyme family protein [Labrys monachus]MDQ0395816.1 glucarate dehydratase [Labrys monachus]